MPRDFLDYLMIRVVDRDGNEVLGMRMNEDTYTIQLKDDRGNLHCRRPKRPLDGK